MLVASWVLAVGALAQVSQIPAWPPVQVAASVAYSGPGDQVSGAIEWVGLRGYNNAYSTGSNSAIDICDAATGLVCTTGIKILSNGSLDVATAAATSACLVTCVVSKLYDQTGNGHHLTCSPTGGSGGACATLTFNCIGSLPCLTFNYISTVLSYTDISGTMTQAQPFSFSFTANAPTASQSVIVSDQGIVLAGFNASGANTGYLYAGSVLSAAANDNSWHAFAGIFNSASMPLSNIVVDNSATSGSTAGTSFTGTLRYGALTAGSFQYTGKAQEMGMWASAFNATQYGNLDANMHSYWGF